MIHRLLSLLFAFLICESNRWVVLITLTFKIAPIIVIPHDQEGSTWDATTKRWKQLCILRSA